MKKRKIALLLLLALWMAFSSTFVASAITTPWIDLQPDAETAIEGHNLALEENVQIVYYVYETEIDGAESGVLFWLEPQEAYLYGTETYKVTESFGMIENPRTGHLCRKYAFPKLSAKMMTVDVYAVSFVKIGEEVTYGSLDKYSVLQYCFNKKDSKTVMPGGTVPLGDLVAATLQQGAVSQLYFGYKTDRLATDTYYQVTVVGGTLPDRTNKGLYKENDAVTLKAGQAPDGMTFSHWENSAGEIVSETVIIPGKNETYTAIFE